MKLLKDEKILKEKLVQYEKKGLQYYSNSESKQIFNEQGAKEEDQTNEVQVYEENAYQVMMRWILTEVQELNAVQECIKSI